MANAGTQDYSGYFPCTDGSKPPSKFDLVPRVDPAVIQKRNESLVRQALKTRHLLGVIPKNKIKPKRVPKTGSSLN